MMTLEELVTGALIQQVGCDEKNILLLECSIDQTVWYSAIKEKKSGVISACVIFVEFGEGALDKVEVKFEQDGPFQFGPSKDLLALLSPTANETALLWRQACWNMHSGQGLIGWPYYVFPDSFLDPSGRIENLSAKAERKAYAQGIKDRFKGLKPGENKEFQEGTPYQRFYQDGYAWAWQEMEIKKIKEIISPTEVTSRRNLH